MNTCVCEVFQLSKIFLKKKCRKNLHIKINCCTFAADCNGHTCYSYCKVGHDIECTNVLNKDFRPRRKALP